MTRGARRPSEAADEHRSEDGDGDGDRDTVTFLSNQVGPSFDVRRIELAPGTERACDADEWADTLVVVERGMMEVTCMNGCRATFVGGDLLCLGWLEPRALRNSGSEVVLLSAVARTPDSRPPRLSDTMASDG